MKEREREGKGCKGDRQFSLPQKQTTGLEVRRPLGFGYVYAVWELVDGS